MALTTDERRFLLSVKRGDPQWGLLPFPTLPSWPGIRWKLVHVRRMASARHAEATERLKSVLGL